MQTEIEIKFLIPHEIPKDFDKLLSSLDVASYSQHQLGNVYFDTADLMLRQLDMGLRIRRCDEYAEQTIKCKGQTLAGVHARPEFNAPIQGDSPDLSTFPSHIWPTAALRDDIAAKLKAQFRTDFLRRQWLICSPTGQIELVWDQGLIVANNQQTPINELEIELKQGSAALLFDFAKRLAQLPGLRLGYLSKAQRGYQLAQLSPPLMVQPLTIKASGVDHISQALRHWQHHEQCCFELANTGLPCYAALEQINLAMTQIITHAEHTSPQWLPELKQWRAQLAQAQQHHHATELLRSLLTGAYLNLQLAIVTERYQQAAACLPPLTVK